MKATAPISVGDLLDRITILTIKAHNISDFDETELNELEDLELKMDLPNSVGYLKNILLSINESCWEVEDAKRLAEKEKNFDKTFVDHSRSVYLFNDLRAQVKKLINVLSDSEIVEYKSHGDYV